MKGPGCGHDDADDGRHGHHRPRRRAVGLEVVPSAVEEISCPRRVGHRRVDQPGSHPACRICLPVNGWTHVPRMSFDLPDPIIPPPWKSTLTEHLYYVQRLCSGTTACHFHAKRRGGRSVESGLTRRGP